MFEPQSATRVHFSTNAPSFRLSLELISDSCNRHALVNLAVLGRIVKVRKLTFCNLAAALISSSAVARVSSCNASCAALGANGGEVFTGEFAYVADRSGTVLLDLWTTMVSEACNSKEK